MAVIWLLVMSIPFFDVLNLQWAVVERFEAISGNLVLVRSIKCEVECGTYEVRSKCNSSVLVSAHLSTDRVGYLGGVQKRQYIPLTTSVCQHIVDKMEEGETLVDLVNSMMMESRRLPPVRVVYSYIMPKIDEHLRATMQYELAVSAARNSGLSEGELRKAKMEVDALKGSAEVLNPKRYKPKNEDDENRRVPRLIVINTGVPVLGVEDSSAIITTSSMTIMDDDDGDDV